MRWLPLLLALFAAWLTLVGAVTVVLVIVNAVRHRVPEEVRANLSERLARGGRSAGRQVAATPAHARRVADTARQVAQGVARSDPAARAAERLQRWRSAAARWLRAAPERAAVGSDTPPPESVAAEPKTSGLSRPHSVMGSLHRPPTTSVGTRTGYHADTASTTSHQKIAEGADR